ncbi:hypothetical protein [Sharpea azabuensis]|uniref:hypothetical protein n=1 Tax=Sharpea azabuensis TaxID=322505 RepID=UPI001568821C|nr:hypothetical protein [Sharpea azabuensis]
MVELDRVRDELKISKKALQFAATGSQSITVSEGKKTDNKIIVVDSIYNDSIQYNDLTKVYYTIGTDTVNIALDIKNTAYFYVYNYKRYKHQKNFFKRLFTWDWKKIKGLEYELVNTNELFDVQDVRVVEI